METTDFFDYPTIGKDPHRVFVRPIGNIQIGDLETNCKKTNRDKILLLASEEKFREFLDIYSYVDMEDFKVRIKWDLVAENFRGFSILASDDLSHDDYDYEFTANNFEFGLEKQNRYFIWIDPVTKTEMGTYEAPNAECAVRQIHKKMRLLEEIRTKKINDDDSKIYRIMLKEFFPQKCIHPKCNKCNKIYKFEIKRGNYYYGEYIGRIGRIKFHGKEMGFLKKPW